MKSQSRTTLSSSRPAANGLATNDVLSIARNATPVPRRPVHQILELVLDGEVRYSRRSRWRKFEGGGGFFVFGIGRRRGREGREGDVADAAILRIEYEGAVGWIRDVSVLWCETEGFRDPGDLRARAVEFQVFDGGRTADVFSPEPLRVRRDNMRPRCMEIRGEAGGLPLSSGCPRCGCCRARCRRR